MIDIKNMGMTYPDGDIPVFEDFSIHIERGEFALITGKSGSGKKKLCLLCSELQQAQRTFR